MGMTILDRRVDDDGGNEMDAMRGARQTVAVAERRTGRIRVMLGMTLALLLAQFLLGMYLNVFVPAPHGQPVLTVHIALGTLLLVVAMVTTVVAVAGRGLVAAVLSASGLVFLVMAWIGGARFLGGGDHNADSYVMATGFILAASCYVAALDRSRRG